MAGALTRDQLERRRRVEQLIRLLAPGLNVILAVGERVSRIVEREDTEYYPVRSGEIGGAGDGERERAPDHPA